MITQELCTHKNSDGTRVVIAPASPFSRTVARLIDIGVSLGNIVFFWVLVSYVEHPITIVSAVLSVFVSIGYLLSADGLLAGQSVGKLLLNIKVIDARTLLPCTWKQSFSRNIILALPYTALFEGINLFAEETLRRGDILAGTMVIRNGSIRVVDEPEEDLRPLKLGGLKNTLEQVKAAQNKK